MQINKISIIIPCFNEKSTIIQTIEKVKEFKDFPIEIIIVDDHSNDGSVDLIKSFNDDKIIKIFHDRNYGKGRALRSALEKCSGDIVLIQDADLEYSPKDYKKLLQPFLDTDADVVYGSRFLGGDSYVRIHFYYHYLANKILTHLCNIFTNLNMTDMETGYKVFKLKCIKSIKIRENSFGVEPEITMKLARKNYKFYEVGISYNGRSYEEGKKITIKDAFRAVYCIIKYHFFD